MKNLCGVLGRLPSEILHMTPWETDLLVQAWNEAQDAASDEVAPPSIEDYDDLVRRYG